MSLQVIYAHNTPDNEVKRRQQNMAMRRYWQLIRETYGSHGRGRALIVVHQAFTPDTPAAQEFLSALAEQARRRLVAMAAEPTNEHAVTSAQRE